MAPRCLVFLLTTGLGLVGCATAPRPPVDPAKWAEARRPLGPIDAPLRTPAAEHARLLEIGRLALEAGHHEEAHDTFYWLLTRARVGLAFARLRGEGLAEAEARFAQARRRAWAAAIELEDADLLLEVDDPLELVRGDEDRAAFLSAVDESGWEEATVRAALALEPAPSLHLKLLGRITEDDEALEAAARELGELGPEAAEIVEKAFSSAVDDEDLPRARRWGARLAAVDPLHPGPFLLERFEAPQGAPPYEAPDAAWYTRADVVGAARGRTTPAALGRLYLAHHAGVAGTAARLALALGCIRAELGADGAQIAREVAEGAVDPEIRRWAQRIATLAKISMGDPEAVEALDAAADRSFFFARLALFQTPAEGPRRNEAARLRATRAVLQFSLPIWAPRDLTARVMLDPEAPEAARARARWALSTGAVGYSFLTRRCLEIPLDAEACGALYPAMDAVVDPSESTMKQTEALAKIAEVTTLDPDWLENFLQLPQDGLLAAAPRLAALAGTPAETTSGFTLAALLVDLARGDDAAFAARLDRNGGLLTVERRIMLRAAHHAAAVQGIERAAILERLWPPGAIGATHVFASADEARAAAVRRRHEGDHVLDRLGRLLGFVAIGRPELARAEAEPVLAILPPEEAADIEARLRLAALAAADGAEEGQVARDAKGSKAPRIEARAKEALGEPAWDARRAQLLRHPRGREAVRAVLMAPGPIDRARAAAFVRTLAPVNSTAAELAEVGEAIEPPPEDLYRQLAVALEDDALAREWALRTRAGSAIRSRALYAARATLADTQTATAAVSAARALLALLPEEERREARHAWAAFLAGEQDALQHLGSEDGPLTLEHPVRRLWALRATLAPQVVFRIWRAHEGEREDGDPSPLAVAQALASSRPDDPQVAAYLCRALIAEDLADPALEPCARAWRKVKDDDTAAAASWLARVRPEDAARVGLSPEQMFAGSRGLAAEYGDSWLFNRAPWAAAEGQVDSAVKDLLVAWALGTPVGEYGLGDALQRSLLTHDAGLALRWATKRNFDGEVHRLFAAGYRAVEEGQPEVAAAYLGPFSRRAEATRDHELGVLGRAVAELVELGVADIEAGRLPREEVAPAFAALDQHDGAAFAPLLAAHPEAWLLWAVSLELALADVLDRAEAAARGEALLKARPDSLLALKDLVNLYLHLGDQDRARALMTAGLARHPDSVGLGKIARRMGMEPPAARPEYLASPEALRAALEAASAPEAELSRRVDIEVGLEGFLPKGFKLVANSSLPFRFEDDLGAFVQGARFPRAGRCAPADCLEQTLVGVQRVGFEVIWRAERAHAAGPAAWSVASKGSYTIVFAAIPRGAQVYLLSFGGHNRLWAERMGAFRLAWETMRPLELGVLGEWAEAMRAATGWRMPKDDLRARARRARPTRGPGCPIEHLLADVSDFGAAALLLDTYLATPDVEDRRALVACAPADSARAAYVAVPALLEEAGALHRFGVTAARQHPDTVAEVARQVIEKVGATTTPTEGAYQRPRSPYGALQVLVALPGAARRALGKSLLGSLDREAHALALAAHVFAGDVAPDDVIAADIRSAPPGPAFLATLAADADAGPEIWDAARERLDALAEDIDEDAELRLAATLAKRLAWQGDLQDRRRLQKIAARAAASPAAEDESRAVEQITMYAEAHRRAVEGRLEPGEKGKTTPKQWARIFMAREIAAKKASAAEAPRGPTEAQLERAPLFRLLPKGRWMLARLPHPDLLASTAKALFTHLDFGDDGQAYWIRRQITQAIEQMGDGALGGGGIDLGGPMTCAEQQGREGFVCVAEVKDPHALRDAFARRNPGSRSAAALPLLAAPGAFALPVALAAAPFIVHVGLFPDEDTPPDEVKSDARILSERVRAPLEIAGHQLERYAQLDVRERSGVVVSEELYLFVGSRLYVFSSERMAEQILGRLPAEDDALSSDADLRWALARWQDEGVVQLANVGAEPSETFAAVMALDSQGATLLLRSREGSESGDVRPLVRHLPASPTALLALAFSDPTSTFGDLEWLSEPPASMGTPPPAWLLEAGHGVAFGWYPEADAPMWQRWVAAVPFDRGLGKALRKKGWGRIRRGRPGQQGELTYLLKDGVLRVGRPKALVLAEQTIDPGERALPLVVRLDSERAAKALEGLGASADVDPKRKIALTLAQRALRATRRLDASAESDPRGDVVRGRLELATREDPGADLDVVATWLRTPKNALPLPKGSAVSPGGPLVLVLRTPDAKAAARAFEGRPRNAVEVIAEDRLAVRVAPEAKVEPAPLEARARREALAETALVQPGSSAVRRVAEALEAETPADKARAAVEWVKANLRYELTQESVGARRILSRGTGDCTEYSVLTVSLLRALGVPAELREGFMADGGRLVAHAWVAWHDGARWHEIDPTNGLLEVGASHVESSVADLVSLLTLDRLEVLEVK